MKNILVILIVLSISFANLVSSEKIDLSVKPEPLPSVEYKFPKYITKTLKNDFKFFIVEDDEQPLVSLSMMIPGGSSVDFKPGLAELSSRLLIKGAGKRNALEIAQTIDGVGAYLDARATSDYIQISAFCLKKHLPIVLEIFSDIVLRPEFPSDELEKIVQMKIAEIQQEKADPSTLANDLSRIVVYGKNHPYSIKATEESVKSIKNSDIKEFYKTYFKPNNATLTIVGDIKPDEITKDIEKVFNGWKKEAFPAIKLPKPNPMPLGVYFVHRPASVQSSIVVTTPTVPFANQDYEVTNLASNVIGGGFAGRLFRTLRETHSYTYTPFGYQTYSKFYNRFLCGADVSNIVTDSAILVIKDQLKQLSTVPAAKEELERIKKFQVGSYLMSFEESDFIANLIQRSDLYGIPIKKVEGYPKRMMSFNNYEVKNAANKYLDPDKAYIVVVGSPDIKGKLEKFGKIYEYDLNLKPLSGEGSKLEKVSLDAEDLLEKMVDAIGGKEALNSVTSLKGEGTGAINYMGQRFEGNVTEKTMLPNSKAVVFKFGMISQSLWCNGKNAWIMTQNSIEKFENEMFKEQLLESVLFKDFKLLQLGYNCDVLGKENNMILMKAVSPQKKEKLYFIDANTFLIYKVEMKEESLEGPITYTETYSDYNKFGNILLPTKKEESSPIYTSSVVYKYEINPTFTGYEFEPVSTKE